MARNDWIEDIRNRQRNIVFPDTVLNQGRFYRNIVYGHTPLNPVQRAGILILGLLILAGACLFCAESIAGLLRTRSAEVRVLSFVDVLLALLSVAVGLLLTLRAVLPGTRPVRLDPRLGKREAKRAPTGGTR